MIDEMMRSFDSLGNVAAFVIVPLLLRTSRLYEGQTRAINNGNVPRGFSALDMRSELVGCGVRLGTMPAASLNS